VNGQDVELRVHVLGAHARCLNSARGAAACGSVRDCLQVCQRCFGVCLVAVAWQRRSGAPTPNCFRSKYEPCFGSIFAFVVLQVCQRFVVSEFHVCVLRNWFWCVTQRAWQRPHRCTSHKHISCECLLHTVARRAPFKRGRRRRNEQETLYPSQIKCSSQSLSQQTLLSLAPGRRVLCLKVSLWMPRRSRTTQAVSFGRSLPASKCIVF
jgi:hypothetical protein